MKNDSRNTPLIYKEIEAHSRAKQERIQNALQANEALKKKEESLIRKFREWSREFREIAKDSSMSGDCKKLVEQGWLLGTCSKVLYYIRNRRYK